MRRNRVDYGVVSMKDLPPYLLGEENGDDTDDTDRSCNHTKSFNSPYRKKYVGHRWPRFYVWTLWICNLGGFRSFDGQGKSRLSMQDL
jgi:hypothetical protein